LMAKYAATFREYFRLLDSRLHDMLEERERGLPWVSKLFMQLAEKERKRLASDLHDEVLQEIMNIRRMLEPTGGDDPQLGPHRLEQIRLGLDNAEFLIRETCQELLPSFLTERGILDAVGKLAEKVRLRTDFELELVLLPVTAVIGDEVTLALYRIVQELVNNALKHSGAGKVRLVVGQEGSELIVRYEDDGVGLAVEEETGLPGTTERLGLRGIAERLRLLNGGFRFDSAPGQGVRVRCSIPTRTEVQHA
jgi:signal transduction histidine kinase